MPSLLETSVAVPQLDPKPPAWRAEHWEGCFEGEWGSVYPYAFDVKAQLNLWAGGVEGAGVMLDVEPEHEKIDVTGARSGDAVDLCVWFHAEFLAKEPFVCAGALNDDHSEIAGAFTVRCLNPTTCRCGGGGGRFRLTKVVS